MSGVAPTSPETSQESEPPISSAKPSIRIVTADTLTQYEGRGELVSRARILDMSEKSGSLIGYIDDGRKAILEPMEVGNETRYLVKSTLPNPSNHSEFPKPSGEELDGRGTE